MTERIFLVLQPSIKDGKLEDFRTVAADMIDAAEADEPGTLNYEWTLSEDQKTCHTYERFADSAAALAHASAFGANFAGRLLDCVDPTGITVHGNPSDELKAALAGLSPTYMTDCGGFAR